MTNQGPSHTPCSCIVDTDMALDDWMALIYLLYAPDVDVRAITVCGTGECHAGPGVRTGLGLLALAGRAGVPVAAARRTRPLRGRNAFPLPVRLGIDLRLGLRLPQPLERAAALGAVDLQIRLLEQAREPLTIIALGPLTNLAELVLRRPDLLGKIAALYVMGGALRVPGNIQAMAPRLDHPFSEWNIFVDPYAADLVFRSGVPIRLVALDATNQVPLTEDFLRRLALRQHTPGSRFVQRVFQRVRSLTSNPLFFWDQLTAVLMTHAGVGQTEPHRLAVLQQPGREQGRVVEHPEGGLVQLYTRVDARRFEEIFLDGINRVRAGAELPALERARSG